MPWGAASLDRSRHRPYCQLLTHYEGPIRFERILVFKLHGDRKVVHRGGCEVAQQATGPGRPGKAERQEEGRQVRCQPQDGPRSGQGEAEHREGKNGGE